jgi:methionyl-tRNA formyltransferase
VRLVYLGSPEAAVPPLQALVAAGHEVVLVVSMPDRRRGRGGATSPTPVKAVALELGLPVTDQLDDVLGVDADLGVVVAYGRILGPDLLAHLPMVNLHFSLLPRWRGAAPVERGLLEGDATTGVCVMAVEQGLDTGGVHARAELPIGPADTAAGLRAQLSEVGATLLVDALAKGLGDPEPQGEDGITYAKKIMVDDLCIDWSAPAVLADRQVRVGGAWTTFRGQRLKVLAAELLDGLPDDLRDVAPGTVGSNATVRCGDGALRLVEVGPEGKRPMAAGDWANGARPAGEQLGTEN